MDEKNEFKKNKKRAENKTTSYTKVIGSIDIKASTVRNDFRKEYDYNFKVCDEGWKSKLELIDSRGTVISLIDYDTSYKITIGGQDIYLELYELYELILAANIISEHRSNYFSPFKIKPTKISKHTKLGENND